MTSTSVPGSTSRRRTAIAAAGLAFVLAASACSGGNPIEQPASAVTGGSGSNSAEPTTIVVSPSTTVTTEPDISFGDDVGIVVEKAEVTENTDGTTSVSGAVSVPTAGGAVDLDNAEIIVEVDPETGEAELIGGKATLPFPTDGILEGAQVGELPVGDMGIAMGRELHHLGAHLQDDREYMYFAFDGGLDVDLPFAGEPGAEAIPPSISVPTGVSAVMVIDPADPYFYVGTQCPDLSADDKQDDDPDSDKRDEDDERRDGTTTTTQPDVDETDDDAGALYTLEPSDLPPGEDCGIGFSLGGNIPAPATSVGDPFNGHVVVDGIVPLYAGIELDGSVVVSVGANGLRSAGWGDVLATVPLIDKLVDIQIPLAEAGVEIQAEGSRIGVAYDGIVGGSDPSYELPLLGIPITIPSTGTVGWDARFGFINDGAGNWSIDPTSYAEASGDFGMGLGAFGELVGLDLDDALTQQASMRIDSTGIALSGSMNAQIHPALNTGGSTDIDLFVSAVDWTDSRLAFDADIELFGHPLAGAHVLLDNNGLVIDGTLDVGVLEIEMAGVVAADRAELSGRAALDLRLDGLANASRNASSALDDAIAAVENIDIAIDAARDEARQNRLERDAGFVAARDAVQNAIDGLDKVDDNVAKNNKRIKELEKKIADEKSWYDGLNAFDKTVKWAGHSGRLTLWRGEIATLVAANVTQRDVYRPAAEATLETTQKALKLIQDGLNALPVDTNPKVAALIISRETAVTTLELVQGTVELFDIEGSLRGELFVSLGTNGVTGSVDSEACGKNGCITLAAGRLVIGAQPEICLEFPGLGEQCLAI